MGAELIEFFVVYEQCSFWSKDKSITSLCDLMIAFGLRWEKLDLINVFGY